MLTRVKHLQHIAISLTVLLYLAQRPSSHDRARTDPRVCLDSIENSTLDTSLDLQNQKQTVFITAHELYCTRLKRLLIYYSAYIPKMGTQTLVFFVAASYMSPIFQAREPKTRSIRDAPADLYAHGHVRTGFALNKV